MSNHRSISQRLKRAKSLEAKQATAMEWSLHWFDEQMQLIEQLERAIRTRSHDDLCIATGQLRAVTKKRFDALNNVLGLLSVSEHEKPLTE